MQASPEEIRGVHMKSYKVHVAIKGIVFLNANSNETAEKEAKKLALMQDVNLVIGDVTVTDIEDDE